MSIWPVIVHIYESVDKLSYPILVRNKMFTNKMIQGYKVSLSQLHTCTDI